jgi:secreted Zn-dependent insulinase-like peptidase
MDVNVGNFSDEADMPGMAHAVEHVCCIAPPLPRRSPY